MTTTQIKKPLPESLMKAIRVSVESPDLTGQEKFEAAVLIAHGYGLWTAHESIDPTRYAIPEKQWGEIADLLMTVTEGDVGKVNRALDWMNIGPSGYKE